MRSLFNLPGKCFSCFYLCCVLLFKQVYAASRNKQTKKRKKRNEFVFVDFGFSSYGYSFWIVDDDGAAGGVYKLCGGGTSNITFHELNFSIRLNPLFLYVFLISFYFIYFLFRYRYYIFYRTQNTTIYYTNNTFFFPLFSYFALYNPNEILSGSIKNTHFIFTIHFPYSFFLFFFLYILLYYTPLLLFLIFIILLYIPFYTLILQTFRCAYQHFPYIITHIYM